MTPEQILSLFKDSDAQPRVTAVCQAGSGGILAALWELSEILHTGLETDMQAISIRQETVEICEFYRLNPYQMASAGSFLIVTEDAQAVIEILEKAGRERKAWGHKSAERAGDHKRRRDKVSGQACAGRAGALAAGRHGQMAAK